jgi:hypothetical protein
MFHKYLFILGIFGVHGLLAAAFFVVDAGPVRAAFACSSPSSPLPDFTPPTIILAANHDWVRVALVSTASP